MKQKLLDELMEVSEEEQKYLDGQGDIERQLYVKEKIEELLFLLLFYILIFSKIK